MKLKKKDLNNYFITEDGIWVRDYITTDSPPLDQNIDLINSKDYSIFLENETQNYKIKYPSIASEKLIYPYIIITSDGFDFANKRKILGTLSKRIDILGVNNVINNWDISSSGRPMTYYIVNNPYAECVKFFPKRVNYFPQCISSTRTFHNFLSKYTQHNNVYTYTTVKNKHYSGLDQNSGAYRIDDYRNPICAAISLAYKFDVKKLLLFCCDDSFADKRPSAEQLENKLWSYPQQQISTKVIDAHLYWMKNKDVDIRYHSSGAKLFNASYISLEDIPEFFDEGIA